MAIAFTDPKLIPINLKIDKVEREIETARSFLEDSKAFPSGHARYLTRMLGFAVHNIYNGIEQIFEDVAKELDGGKPKGDSTHMALIQQMAVATPFRPALISMENLEGPGSFDDLRRFWLVVRHSYGMELREREVREKFDAATGRIWPAVLQSLECLREHLEKTVDPEPSEPSAEDDVKGCGM